MYQWCAYYTIFKKLRGTTTLTNTIKYFFIVYELGIALDILRSILHIKF